MALNPPKPRILRGGHSDYVGCVSFSPDGEFLASGSRDRSILLWHPETGERLGAFTGHRYSVNSVAFSPTGELLASGAGQAFELGEVRLWDVARGALIQTLEQSCDFVDWVGFSPAGGALAYATGSGCGPREPIEPKVTVIEVGSGKIRFSALRRNCGAFSPDGKWFAVGGPDSEIILLDAQTGNARRTLKGLCGNVLWTAFSTQALLATGSQEVEEGAPYGAVTLWDVKSGTIQDALRQPRRSISSLAFSPSGRWLACAPSESHIELWDVSAREPIAAFPYSSPPYWGPHQFAFSPDEQWLASGALDGEILLWPLNTLRD